MSENFTAPPDEQPLPVADVPRREMYFDGGGTGRNPVRVGPWRHGFRWLRQVERNGFVVVWTLSRERGIVFRQIACSRDCLWRGQGRKLVAELLRQARRDMRAK